MIFLPGVASADSTVSASTSFDDRFAAVERTQLPRPQLTPAADPPKDIAGDIAKLRTPSSVLDGRARYRAVIEKEAAQAGLPPEIAEAVMAVESGYNPHAIGGVGEIGLMQILPSTAAMLGFRGSLAELAVPETNIRYGVTYLAKAWRLAGGDLCTAAMKYRAGHGETRFSVLSVNYCLAVRAKLAARGFPVTGNVPVATFGEAARGGGCGRKCLGGAHMGSVNLAALNTRLSALVVQTRAGR
ncbi:transglycosylase SLT domain-containing protein [Bradyrhizobium sp. WSM 1738]|uniref:lytic transglycosylase domain-containing protein n=1 Tax=Bradyrhizobium hereditatis TaxID=2821405 RepID=UPI001CE30CCC|nr:transglycosylase SLT domain-containing protein [Bradyrhizobium hereditatis]MCA6116445.1 transglycosylase SLT domain-containing protein [Bradyrhizobium hereditatis]